MTRLQKFLLSVIYFLILAGLWLALMCLNVYQGDTEIVHELSNDTQILVHVPLRDDFQTEWFCDEVGLPWEYDESITMKYETCVRPTQYLTYGTRTTSLQFERNEPPKCYLYELKKNKSCYLDVWLQSGIFVQISIPDYYDEASLPLLTLPLAYNISSVEAIWVNCKH